MSLTINARAGDPASARVPLLAVLLPAGTASVPKELRALDRLFGGQFALALRRRDFRGGRDEQFAVSRAGRGGPSRLVLVGIGAGDRVAGLRRGAAVAARAAHKAGVGTLALTAGDLTVAEAEAVTVGVGLGAWEYTDLKTPVAEGEQRAPLGAVTVYSTGDSAALVAGVDAGNAIAAGYATARRLAMMPPNLCTPEHLAATAEDIGRRHGMKVTVLGRAELTKLKAGAFLAVAQGTSQDPKLVSLEYRGAPRGAPVVLVGKGLCFDTGGISIKPAQGMEWMKFDMCGAAGVLGAMETIARLKLPINVVGLIGATTNMPSGEAYKPGDVIRAMNGKTIEVINTDAEGRMVLADLLTYAKRFKPAAVVDAATLTGACVIALGNSATAVLGKDDALVEELLASASRAGEPGWQLPLWDTYRELIASDVADVKNSGGRAAGTITAAHFLAEFIGDYPWAHLDVAGTAYSEGDLGYIPKGPTGTPVGTFVEFVRGRAQQ
jgi:leucyl aminopeptidase